jgi:hypothetical protein
MIHYIALITALALSCVSGSFSIIGLTTLFSGAFWPVILMGGTLEIAKLVSISWLYRNWRNAPKAIKYYLSVVVLVLVLINSAGVFGFLSKAHIETYANIQGQGVEQLQVIDQEIANKQSQADDFTKQVEFVDTATQKLVDTKKVNQALTIETQRHKQRDQLIQQRQTLLDEIEKLKVDKIKITTSKRQAEAEIGPIKYVAMLLYNDANEDQIERSVRIMILLLVAVCDPTAIVLLIAANHGLKTKEIKSDLTKDDFHDKVISFDNAFDERT